MPPWLIIGAGAVTAALSTPLQLSDWISFHAAHRPPSRISGAAARRRNLLLISLISITGSGTFTDPKRNQYHLGLGFGVLPAGAESDAARLSRRSKPSNASHLRLPIPSTWLRLLHSGDVGAGAGGVGFLTSIRPWTKMSSAAHISEAEAEAAPWKVKSKRS